VNARFKQFLYMDLKKVLQQVDRPSNLVEFTKFIVFVGADDDPEIFDILSDEINKSMRRMTVDDILTILVNFAHTLNPNSQELFEAAN